MNDRKFLPAIIFFSTMIFFFAWHQFFYEPVQREILNTELEARRLREIEREIFELKARHENLAALVEEKYFELDAAKNFLPPTLDQDKFIDELYRAADAQKVQVTAVRAGEIISAEKISAQFVSVKLEGNFVSLLNFIREIVDGERLARLENFSVAAAEINVVSAELRFKIFAATP